MPPRPVAWTLTTGEDGMRTQARGLAHAVAASVVEKTAPPASVLDWLSTWLGGAGLARAFPPPWPDILVTCGRRSAPYAAALKRASGGGILTVHIQDPRAYRRAFDLIVAMEHDRIAAGPRVIKVPTALHDVTPHALAAAEEAWRERFAALGHPLVGVTIGGSLRGRRFTREDAARLIDGLSRLRRELDAGLAITPSRRTPIEAREMLGAAFAGDARVFLWDLEGSNPYRAILALSDRLVVTTDSVSMVSEAIATGTATELLDLGFPRHTDFVQRLVDSGAARRFSGDPSEPRTRAVVDSNALAAAAVKALLQDRTGVSGKAS